jgi:flagellar basal body-associated protein FliL
MKKETKNKKKSKKIIFIIIGVLLFLVALAYLIWHITRPVPFVVREKIEILDAKGEYSNPVYLYAANSNGEQINEGINFNDSKAEYKFYDNTFDEAYDNAKTLYSTATITKK